MHAATSKIARLASTYASHVPFLASAHTNGMVATGVVVGAMVEMDCASVSIGDSTSRRNPYVELSGAICVAWVIRLVSCFSKFQFLTSGGYDTALGDVDASALQAVRELCTWRCAIFDETSCPVRNWRFE